MRLQCTVFGAGATDGAVSEGAAIVVSHSIELARPEDRPRLMEQDAQALSDILRRSLPQGTLDRLSVLLLKRLVSDRLAAVEP